MNVESQVSTGWAGRSPLPGTGRESAPSPSWPSEDPLINYEQHAGYEDLVRGRGPRVTEEEIDAASEEFGIPFPPDYREFLLETGGAVIGAHGIYGLREVDFMGDFWSVIEANKSIRKAGWPGIEGWLIVEEDGSGNQIGIAPDGRVMRSDHNAGFLAEVIADDFEAFIRQRCLRIDPLP